VRSSTLWPSTANDFPVTIHLLTIDTPVYNHEIKIIKPLFLLDLLPWLSFLWSAPLQVIIAMFQLYNELGNAVFGGLGLMILFIPMNLLVARKVKEIQIRQMKLKDQRLKSMNEILSGMKVLKVMPNLDQSIH
jgi:hypothetical protein